VGTQSLRSLVLHEPRIAGLPDWRQSFPEATARL